ncbi:MAG: hypothetical protein QOI45_136 [Thermoleophilaceae bacterium]|jgi:hypothetical protein|nr:hypothetical protein [Thermoleophilaceae bacterium]
MRACRAEDSPTLAGRRKQKPGREVPMTRVGARRECTWVLLRRSSADRVTDADDAGGEDVGPQPASVDHRPQQGGAGEALEV